MRILTAGVRVVSDSCLFCGHFLPGCFVQLWHFSTCLVLLRFLCYVWMISPEGLLFSKRRLRMHLGEWGGGGERWNCSHDGIFERIIFKKTYKKNNNSNHISNVTLHAEIWTFSSRIRKYKGCPLLSFLFRMAQGILEMVTS